MDADRPLADWRSDAPYAELDACDRHGFAWEWLRRSRDYRIASAGQGPHRIDRALAASFGLHRFEACYRGVPTARPIWSADTDPYVLTIEARPARAEPDAFDVVRFGPLATLVVGHDACEHWLLSDGWRQIRLDVVCGTLVDGPVHLAYRIDGLVRASRPLITLGRLIALARTGRMVPSLFQRERRAPRWSLVLRVHDALAAGASQREIAERLFDLGELRRWRISAPSYRRRIQRLVEAARSAASTDPKHWLSDAFS